MISRGIWISFSLTPKLLLQRRRRQPQVHLEFPRQAVALRLPPACATASATAFASSRVKMRVDAIDVTERPALAAVKQRRWGVRQDLGLEELQHHAPVLLVRALEPVLLPPLPLVAAEVVDVERAVGLALVVQLALQLDQPLAAGVDGEPAQVAMIQRRPKPLRHCARRAAAAEEVGDEVAFVG